MPPEGEPGSGVEVQPTKLKVRKPKKDGILPLPPRAAHDGVGP